MNKAMQVMVDERLLQQIDDLAKELHVSRSVIFRMGAALLVCNDQNFAKYGFSKMLVNSHFTLRR